MLYKHYIEKDKDGNIIKSFTNGFEQPTKDSILVRESSERHFNLDLYIFENGKAKHKYIYDKEKDCKYREKVQNKSNSKKKLKKKGGK